MKELKSLKRHGTWKVTTLGDVEGKGPDTELGTWTGNIEDIAYHLKDKAFTSLTFKMVDGDTVPHIVKGSASVQIVIEGSHSQITQTRYLKDSIPPEAHVEVTDGNYYGATKIVFHEHPTYKELTERKKELEEELKSIEKLLPNNP